MHDDQIIVNLIVDCMYTGNVCVVTEYCDTLFVTIRD